MTGKATKKAMYNIAMKKSNDYAKKLSQLDSTQRIEKKALSILKQVSANCASFVTIDFEEHCYEAREFRVFGQKYHDFDQWKPIYNTLNGDNRDSFLIFSFSVVMAKHCLLEPSLQKIDGGSADEKFVHSIKSGIIKEILLEWQEFWNENGCIPCEVIK